MAGTWLEYRSEFFWAKIFGFLPESPFFAIGPRISSIALAKTVNLAPWDRFFAFLFPSYGRFREGNPPMQQKVLPHPTVRHWLTVTALARSARVPLDKRIAEHAGQLNIYIIQLCEIIRGHRWTVQPACWSYRSLQGGFKEMDLCGECFNFSFIFF